MVRIPILRAGSADAFPPVEFALHEPDGLLAAGGDLAPERLLDAYRRGIFPWYSEGEPILWWSPDPRTVFATDKIHISTRLARTLRQSRWTLRADSAFAEVVQACAAPRRRHGNGGTWITAAMIAAYRRLHELGFAHSVEVYDPGQGLVGGIYGVAVGRMFFGESMFSHATNGSKIALIALCQALNAWRFPLLDAQVASPHLATLGAFAMPRAQFIAHVAGATLQIGQPGSWRQLWPLATAAELVDARLREGAGST